MGKPTITAGEGEAKAEEPKRRSISVSIENYNALDAIAKKERRQIGAQTDIVLENAMSGNRAITGPLEK